MTEEFILEVLTREYITYKGRTSVGSSYRNKTLLIKTAGVPNSNSFNSAEEIQFVQVIRIQYYYIHT